MKRILFIAPLPPPITGNSLAAQKVIDGLEGDFQFEIINYSKKNFNAGIGSIWRIFEIMIVLYKILKQQSRCDIVYLTLSQSIAGNLKDNLILFLTKGKKQIVHLHGGGLDKTVFNKSRFLRFINSINFRRIHSVIILSEGMKRIFRGMVDDLKLTVIPNYVDNQLLSPDSEWHNRKLGKLKILYLSNLIREKGYQELLAAFEKISRKGIAQCELHFAGTFDSSEDEERFKSRLAGIPGAFFHGYVQGDRKKDLLLQSHVFCLPTYYPFEGQPISILEAYSAGCFVLTTAKGGIPDIFSDKDNGFLLESTCVEEIENKLSQILRLSPEQIFIIGERNRSLALNQYSERLYLTRMRAIFDSIEG